MRPLALIASIAALLATAACADLTAPRHDCPGGTVLTDGVCTAK